MDNRPATRRVVVLAGPSAVGKTTLVRCVQQHIPHLYFSVSATTRPPRPGEVDGRDYYFVSTEQFDTLIKTDALLEWAEIHGGLQRSGTPLAPIQEALAQGRPVLIEVDLAGVRAIKQKIPDAISVFLAPPSWDILKQRLIDRATEPSHIIAQRLHTAREELAAKDEFDQIIINNQVEIACKQLVALLR